MSFQVSKSAARKPHLSAQAPTTGRIAELTRAVIPLDEKAGYVAEIAKLWAEAQDRFLTIGRYLALIKFRSQRCKNCAGLPLLASFGAASDPCCGRSQPTRHCRAL